MRSIFSILVKCPFLLSISRCPTMNMVERLVMCVDKKYIWSTFTVTVKCPTFFFFSEFWLPFVSMAERISFLQMIMLTHFYLRGKGSLIGACTKPRKATISFVVCVCSSVRMERTRLPWIDFHEILYLGIFRQSVEKIPVPLKFWGPGVA